MAFLEIIFMTVNFISMFSRLKTQFPNFTSNFQIGNIISNFSCSVSYFLHLVFQNINLVFISFRREGLFKSKFVQWFPILCALIFFCNLFSLINFSTIASIKFSFIGAYSCIHIDLPPSFAVSIMILQPLCMGSLNISFGLHIR